MGIAGSSPARGTNHVFGIIILELFTIFIYFIIIYYFFLHANEAHEHAYLKIHFNLMNFILIFFFCKFSKDLISTD